ncbi:MAG: TetR/AcrR family transcriptional regulator [Propionibacteriaceae bacterium]|nr:TetR/AcrR family transcriptional regulator [Propionibacteriaceae bacterium]
MDETRTPSVRAAILEAATDLIRIHGVAGTSISDVIARSGTSAGAIYHHFGSKERLVLEVGRNAVARPMMMVMQTSVGLSPTHLLDAALAQVGRDEHTPELLLQIWAGARSDIPLSRVLRTEASGVRAGIRAYLAAWCAENAPTADPDSIVDLITGLVMGYAVQRALALNSDPDAYRALASGLLDAVIEAAHRGPTPAAVAEQSDSGGLRAPVQVARQ